MEPKILRTPVPFKTLTRSIAWALLGICLVLSGCGGDVGGSGAPTATNQVGNNNAAPNNNAASRIPAPQPGANPATLPVTTVRFINQSTNVSAQQWTDCVGHINWQLTTDLNPRWGVHGLATVYSGPLDLSQPTVVLQDRQDGPGGYTQSGIGYVAYRVNTANLWSAYCSHVTINLLTPGYLAGQSVEAFDYREPDYSRAGPYQLADFDFPSRHGFPGVYFDFQGNPAYDLLHILPGP